MNYKPFDLKAALKGVKAWIVSSNGASVYGVAEFPSDELVVRRTSSACVTFDRNGEGLTWALGTVPIEFEVEA